MRVEAVELARPGRRVTNDELVSLIRDQSRATYEGDLEKIIRRIRLLLRRSGAEQRYWLASHESVMELVRKAISAALEACCADAADIDLLIYAGADRGFVEPANAYVIAQALGMHDVQCFDVVDACNSWSRAMQLAQALFRTDGYRTAVVVNAEFPMFEGGPIFPQLFRLHGPEELAYSFAGFTLGEGATATVLSRAAEREWEFHFSSRPDLADLCTVPLIGYQRFCHPSERIGLRGSNSFTSFSGEMFAAATPAVLDLFRRLSTSPADIQLIIPHAAARRIVNAGATLLGVDHLVFYIYPQFGNLAAASIPASMALAVEQGILRRGDRVVCCGASAGMSFAVYSFRF